MTGELVFLTVYAALCAGLALATAFAWRGARPGRACDALSDVEIAALNGGARRAVVTALTALRADHVTVTAGGGLVAGHPPPVDAGELEAELFEAIRRARERRGADIVGEAVDGAAVRRMLATLVGDGLLLGEGAAARMRVLWLRAVWLAICGAAGLAGRPSRSPLRRGDAGQRGAVVDGPRLRNGARPSRRDTDLGRLHDGVRGGSQLRLRRRLRMRLTSNIS